MIYLLTKFIQSTFSLLLLLQDLTVCCLQNLPKPILLCYFFVTALAVHKSLVTQINSNFDSVAPFVTAVAVSIVCPDQYTLTLLLLLSVCYQVCSPGLQKITQVTPRWSCYVYATTVAILNTIFNYTHSQ